MVHIRWDMRLTDEIVLRKLASGEYESTQEAIAEKLGCHHKTVWRAIKRLKDLGYVESSGAGNGHEARTYTVNLEALPDDLRRNITN